MIFDGLKGIQKPREVQQRSVTAVDRLLAERDKVAQSEMGLSYEEALQEVRAQLTKQAATLEFTAADLTALVLATANSDYDEKTWERVGLYTGTLLTVLTRRNPSASVHLNLSDGYFPCLFYAAQEVGRLTVTHACGDNILRYLAWKGHAESICASHIHGDDTFSSAGADEGNIRQLIASHISGHRALIWAAFREGEIGQLIASHITGDRTLDGAADHGKIGQLIASHISGDKALMWAAYHGKIGQLIASHITGNGTLAWATHQGTIGQLIASHISGDDTLFNATYNGKVEQLVTSHLQGKRTLQGLGRNVQQHLHDEHAEAWLRQHKLDFLLDPHSTPDPDSIETFAQKLHQIYLASTQALHQQQAPSE